MKLSLSEISTPNASFEDDVRAYAAAGFDAIGIWEFKLPEDDAANRALLREAGLAVASCVPAVPSILPIFLPGMEKPSDPSERVAALVASAKRLAAYEPECVVCLTGAAGDFEPSRARALVVDGLREVAAAAEEAGQAAGDMVTVLRSRLGRTGVLRGQGNLPASRALAESVLRTAEELSLRDVQAMASADLGAVLVLQGQFPESVQARYRAFRLADDQIQRMRYLGELGEGLTANFETGRPPGIPQGQEQRLVMSIAAAANFETSGPHAAVVQVDGEELGRARFYLMEAPPDEGLV